MQKSANNCFNLTRSVVTIFAVANARQKIAPTGSQVKQMLERRRLRGA